MEVGRGSEVWKQTKVAGVEFWPRTVAAAEQVKFIKRKFGKKAKRLLEVEFDAADATSGFAVTMIPKWNDHLFRAVYRDGRCVDFQQDG